MNALRLQALNAELLASLSIGAQLLAALHGNLTADQAVRSIYLNAVPTGVNLVTSGKPFGLTSPEALSAVFQAAYDDLSRAASASSSATAGRRLAQATCT